MSAAEELKQLREWVEVATAAAPSWARPLELDDFRVLPGEVEVNYRSRQYGAATPLPHLLAAGFFAPAIIDRSTREVRFTGAPTLEVVLDDNTPPDARELRVIASVLRRLADDARAIGVAP